MIVTSYLLSLIRSKSWSIKDARYSLLPISSSGFLNQINSLVYILASLFGSIQVPTTFICISMQYHQKSWHLALLPIYTYPNIHFTLWYMIIMDLLVPPWLLHMGDIMFIHLFLQLWHQVYIYIRIILLCTLPYICIHDHICIFICHAKPCQNHITQPLHA